MTSTKPTHDSRSILFATAILVGAWAFGTGCVSTSGSGGSRASTVRLSAVQMIDRSSYLIQVDDDMRKNLDKPAGAKADGYELLQAAQYTEAEIKARSRLMAEPNDEAAMDLLASSLLLQENYRLAWYYAELAAKKYGDSPTNLNLRGLVIYLSTTTETQHRRLQAEDYFKKAFRSSPKQIAAGVNLGQMFLESGNVVSARAYFKKAASRCKSCDAPQFGLALVAIHQNNYKLARSILKGVTERNPANLEAMYYLAHVYQYGDKNRQLAIDTLEDLIASAPDSASRMKNKARKALAQFKRSGGANT